MSVVIQLAVLIEIHCMGRSKKRRDDGTLSHPRICKQLYGPSQSDV